MSKHQLIEAASEAILGFDWHNYGLDEVGEADPAYARELAEAVVTRIKAVPRWRPIPGLPVGNVDAAREPYDDPEPVGTQDDGETGPEEINA